MRYDDLLRPSFLRDLALRYGFSPSKAYGQNYLISKKPIEMMIEAGELTSSDTVVEVGPGFGVLTLAMAPLVKRVVSFEIERTLQPYWEDQQKEYPNIDIIWGNVLKKFSSSHFFSQGELPVYKVIANLPYQITSQVIRMFLEQEHPPERVIIMVQKEVADRIVAKPGDMSLLAVSVQYYGEAHIVCKVPRGSFWPSPKVDSAVVHIQVHRQEDISNRSMNDEQFFRVVKAAFANKRKQAWRNIATGLNIDAVVVKAAIQDICGNEKIRAEAVSLSEWRQLVERIFNYNNNT
ncbi:MAG: ribosomal RNA small subunit methyltransferase A [Candidatus Magasanikbacteria bacterium]|uniref:Ribosomal RNA small subunit methyltransferase A n=1 Tax=Candidatus Magasanikbacteria bacterium CG10_big_fil_rev_8_21_14_0_10_38_6 TaxID=1974647 RepID=A0A2M6P0Z8_9BACT|nr:ribosomal RNA small subunit methyltransferase A [Candidatus Magasanikbacteria bacterium]PIR77395.1 MAG: ribosomal RNA small subunit methyltransferase A [Candidatus Magasanikbacteria bacterium CG10_big_fil_rev_8_21_14_0_10_38_6]